MFIAMLFVLRLFADERLRQRDACFAAPCYDAHDAIFAYLFAEVFAVFRAHDVTLFSLMPFEHISILLFDCLHDYHARRRCLHADFY